MTIHGAIPRGGYKQQPRRIPRSLGFARHVLAFDGMDDCVNRAIMTGLSRSKLTFMFGSKQLGVKGHFMHPIAIFGGHNATVFVVPNTYTYWYKFGINGMFHEGYIAELDDRKHFIAVTFDGVHIRAYVDGTLRIIPREAPGQVTGGDESFFVGATGLGSSPSGNWFYGLINGIWIYNQVLLAEEIEWNILNYHNPIRSGLVLWLPMEEGAGEVVYDKSGYGNDGTLLPAGGLGPTWERLRQWELCAAIE